VKRFAGAGNAGIVSDSGTGQIARHDVWTTVRLGYVHYRVAKPAADDVRFMLFDLHGVGQISRTDFQPQSFIRANISRYFSTVFQRHRTKKTRVPMFSDPSGDVVTTRCAMKFDVVM